MHPSDAHTKFHDESMTLLQASTYLMKVHSAVLNAPQPFSEVHSELSQRLAPTYQDPHHYFMSRLFIAYIAAFELYLSNMVTAVVLRCPKKAGSVQFRLAEVLDAGDTETLVRRAIDELLNKMLYKKPLEYLDELAALLSVDKAIFAPGWPVFVEAKARRDLGAHADWTCNATYIRKLHEAGIESTLKLGDSAVPDWRDYTRRVSDALYDLSRLLTAAVTEKHWRQDGTGTDA